MHFNFQGTESKIYDIELSTYIFDPIELKAVNICQNFGKVLKVKNFPSLSFNIHQLGHSSKQMSNI